MGKLYIIGVGPGDPELITIKAIKLMKKCEIIAIPGANPKNSVAYKIAKGACPEIEGKAKLYLTTPMTKDADVLEQCYKKSAETIEKELDAGNDVALLTLGDPTIYSTSIYILRIIKNDGYDAQIINGVPSFCAVAARLGDSLVDRDQKLHIIPASYQIEESLKLDGTKIMMKAASKLKEVCDIIKNEDCSASMIENCGMENEKIYFHKDEFPSEGSYYSVIVVKE